MLENAQRSGRVSQESVKLTLTLYLSAERHNRSAVLSGNGAGHHRCVLPIRTWLLMTMTQ
jgi:hypothetical protein